MLGTMESHPHLCTPGILKVAAHQLNIVFGTSRNTSDLIGRCLGVVVGESWRRVWLRAAFAERPRQRPEIASSRTQFDAGVGVLPLLPQQVQPHRALLRHLEKPLERHAAEVDRHGVVLGENDDLARCDTDRTSARPRLRNRGPPHPARIPPHRCSPQTIPPSSAKGAS
jgi:hypothetical protein